MPTATTQTETAPGTREATPPGWITLAEGVPAPKPLAPTTAALMAHTVDFARHAPSDAPPETPASLQREPTVVVAEATDAPEKQTAIEPSQAIVAETPVAEPASPTVVAEAESEIPPILRTVYTSGSQILVQATGLIAMATSSRGGHEGHAANPRLLDATSDARPRGHDDDVVDGSGTATHAPRCSQRSATGLLVCQIDGGR